MGIMQFEGIDYNFRPTSYWDIYENSVVKTGTAARLWTVPFPQECSVDANAVRREIGPH